MKAYRRDWRRFHNDGMYNGTFDPETDAETVTRAFIAERMTVATRGEKKPAPYPISNFHSRAFPKIWMRSPTQASGELDKVVGFPIVPRPLRQQLKELSFDEKDLDPEIREELAGLIYKATLQASSTFMNSLRERVSSASRAGSGGARVGGSYIQGANFNPKTLISLLNIYRVHYNFFEPRPYSSPFEEPAAATRKPVLAPRSLRIPGTNEHVELPPRTRRKPKRSTPAMRHGIDTLVRRKSLSENILNHWNRL